MGFITFFTLIGILFLPGAIASKLNRSGWDYLCDDCIQKLSEEEPVGPNVLDSPDN